MINTENVSYTYNNEGRLHTISTEITTYTFLYDYFGNQASVNGYTEEYVYNDLELLSEVWYNVGEDEPTLAYEYEYTASGQVYKITDNVQERETIHRYDTSGRLVGVVQYDSDDMYHDFSTGITYNNKGELYSVNHRINCINSNTTSSGVASITYYNFYETDGRFYRVNVVSPETNGYETYTYDDYDRVYKVTHNYHLIEDQYTEFNNEITYNYRNEGANTSGQVTVYESKINGEGSFAYLNSYDDNGNITKITVYDSDGNEKELRYYYDDIGQLIREDNELLGETWVYNYDDAGNIIGKGLCDLTPEGVTATPSGGVEYTYYLSSWGDLLIEFDQVPITYDDIGNPLTYYNGRAYTFTWRGRRMETAQVSGKTMSFTYNDEGIRTSKTVNGVTTTYYLNGSQIVGEETNGNLTIYLYDSMGMPIGMQYHDASYSAGQFDVFWYEKNMQGDVVAIYNQYGAKLISYRYDAWGRVFETVHGGSTPNDPERKNPFRYRGYYYDLDLGLYYLNSRYYDSVTCRFINADKLFNDDILGNNLYAYCGNNPVNRADEDGEGWWIPVGALVGAISGAATKFVSNVATGEKWNDGILGAAVSGLVSGAIASATGNIALASFAGSASESLTNEIVSYIPVVSDMNGQSSTDSLTTENLIDSINTVLKDTIKDGLTSLALGSLTQKIVPTNNGWFKPRKFKSCFVGKYARKAHMQTTIQSLLQMDVSILDPTMSEMWDQCQEAIVEIFN